jgi:hypothetical protein
MHRETPLGETWWDLRAASYDAPRWDAKEKKSPPAEKLILFSIGSKPPEFSVHSHKELTGVN